MWREKGKGFLNDLRRTVQEMSTRGPTVEGITQSWGAGAGVQLGGNILA